MPLTRRVSPSSLSCFRRCRYRYYLSYLKNYISYPSIGQVRGTVCHAAMAKWYENFDRKAALTAFNDKLWEVQQESGVDLDNLYYDILPILERFFAWSEINDKQAMRMKFISAERVLETKLDEFTLMGILDGIVEVDGRNWILEHKFYKQVSTGHLDLDFQVSVYMLLATRAGLKPAGVVYNIVRMAEKGKAVESPVERVLVYRNPEGLDLLQYEILAQCRDMSEFHDKGGTSAYRNPTKDCGWDCSFHQVCLGLNDSGSAPILEKWAVDTSHEYSNKEKSYE